MLTVAMLFLGHYFFLKHQLNQMNRTVSDLQAQKENYTRLKGEVDEAEKKLTALKKQRNFMQGDALAKERVLRAMVAVLARGGFKDFVLQRMECLGGD